jgi:putative membrane protein
VIRPVLWKGVAAGVAGGLAGSWAMGQMHGLIVKLTGGSASQQGQSQAEDSTVKTARTVAQPILNRQLTPVEARAGGAIVHYAFGSSIAAAYGVAAEFVPQVTSGAGAPMGAAVWLGAHVITVPALGLAPPVTQSHASFEIAEFFAHLAYGCATELVRSGVRRLLRG